ncbi:ABC transporter permease YtrF precursor [Vibrio aerogenes CECT 7868]|uniref:ABC transporter permease YtrF n=1 Tax=Vibrio aerogenes CECT 7868 TaxID=1216006 RepID=A0A1M5X9K1_9VIBR|nr:ABC transporter permease [Vibrio aerogenes]SHH96238.1 ABC transporter permease YtrF precursor [Vibrio aerogenes CECT 7868]
MGRLISNEVRKAWLNLRRNGRRSALSVLIISIAVFALCSTGGFGLYTYQSLKEQTARSTGHITLSQPGYFAMDEDLPLDHGLTDYRQLVKSFISAPEIRSILPRIELNGLVSNGNKSTIFMGIGVDAQEFDMKGPFLDVLEGKTLSDPNSPRYRPDEPEVMLGKELAKNLKVSVGDWVTLLSTTTDGALNAIDFKVHGIYATGIPELDKRQLYLHLSAAQDLLVTQKVSTLSVYLFDTDQTTAVQHRIDQRLSKMKLAQPVITTPWQARAFFYEKVKNLYNRIFAIMGGVMALVVFVALFNTMTMAVTERTREIGTLAALGAYPGEIIRGFLKEAGLMSLLGCCIGGIFSGLIAAVLMVADIQMPPAPGRTESYPLYIYFSPALFGIVALIIIVICLMAAWLSARKGVNKPITEALIHV